VHRQARPADALTSSGSQSSSASAASGWQCRLPLGELYLLLKDFHLGLDAARELGVPMPIAAETEQIVQGMVALKGDEVDFATLLELVAEASGLELAPENVAVDDGLAPMNGVDKARAA
jgi:NAD-binding of NADP-dependent 3-hydroxyisobutyrate dehydrogenase